MDVDELKTAYTLELNNIRYFFCSGGCRAEFERHPDEYVSPLEKTAEREFDV